MKPEDFFNEKATVWDEICLHPKHKLEYIFNKIPLKIGDYCLDIGSGTGVTLPYIEEKIGEMGHITAIDFACNMIEIAQEKYRNIYNNIDFIVQDFYHHTSDILYDCIIAYSCYPHFTDRLAFIDKINELLKINGVIVIAHSEGKDCINLMHQVRLKDFISFLPLEPVENTVNLFQRKNFQLLYIEDTSNYYVFIGKKTHD